MKLNWGPVLWPLLLTFACATMPQGQVLEEKPLTVKRQKICVLGDLGMGRPEQADVAKELVREKCHRILMTGDLIYSQGLEDANDPDLEEKFLKFYRPVYETGNRPNLYLVMGNHDDEGNVDAWKEVARNNSKIIFPSRYYLIKSGRECILGLDSNLFRGWRQYFQGEKQAQWLEKLEQDLKKDCEHTIAFTHHNYIGAEKHINVPKIYKNFLEEKLLGKVDYLITGHVHILKDQGVKKGTRVLISGAGGGPYMGFDPGYVVLELVDGHIRHTFKKVPFTRIP